MNIDTVKLTELLTEKELKVAQDTISKMARVAVQISDENGTPITEGSNYIRFCSEFCRASEEGRKRCQECDRNSAIEVLERKEPYFYFCHANVIDFGAPIMLGDRLIGTVVGGQVLTEEPDTEKMRDIAAELGVDEDEFVEAALQIPVVPMHAVKRCAEFIYDYAQMLSAMALKSYTAQKEGQEALKAAVAKTDFLANMSHEIRTPMNAILGMSEIALREEMSPKARDYINQVSSSANMLLTIINDILDYSKLEAGKMSIVEAKYAPADVLKDVCGIIGERIKGKAGDVEFVVDFDPSMPCGLIGDDVRLKQIIVNLANNAVKFTEEGQVMLRMGYDNRPDGSILLKCDVCDTGIGIKPDDLERLFNSFEQVDSKRNRKVEGTGLGLAIVKELVEAMGGAIHVESEYGNGSTFSFAVPQKVSDRERTVKYIDECPSVVGVLGSPYFKNQLRKDMDKLGAQYIDADVNNAAGIFDSLHVDFGITEEELINENYQGVVSKHIHTKYVVIADDDAKDYSGVENIVVLTRPVTILQLASVLLGQEIEKKDESPEAALDFTAPDANILVVDDNEVNLSVAEGLLEPLNMNIDTADSGKKALEMMADKRYDIIFMDHMMPEMDGVETTQEIRKRFPEYDDVPVVALTANALATAEDELRAAGMNDFVAKPIVLTVIVGVIKKWLPENKIKALEEGVAEIVDNKDDGFMDKLDFLNTKSAMELLKTEKLYLKVLKDYYHMIDKKHDKIKGCVESGDIGLYTVEVHALKSSSKQIGADALSDMAKDLEAAGNAKDVETINKMNGPMLEEYKRIKEMLTGVFGEEDTMSSSPDSRQAKSEMSREDIIAEVEKIEAAIDELDLETAEELAIALADTGLSDEIKELACKLKEMLSDMDLDGCTEVIEEIKKK